MSNGSKPIERRRILNYSLRHAKNIERKMMGEALMRLSPLAPLANYRYVGFGSEFFNDFSLYHQKLGINDMVSIERDEARIERCRFNQPYRCIKLVKGDSTQVLPQLDWKSRAIVWLDYVDKLDKSIVEDIRFVTSRMQSGSVGIWTVNAHPWGGSVDEETQEKVKASDWPKRRLSKLKNLFGNARSFQGLSGTELGHWGLATLFHEVITDEIHRALNDRNAASDEKDRLKFRQYFHFRYADGQRMLTVGGVFLNDADSGKLNDDAFSDLDFIRTGKESYELNPPTLTGREVRFLNQLLPPDAAGLPSIKWLEADDTDSFKKLYRYYPVFSESEL